MRVITLAVALLLGPPLWAQQATPAPQTQAQQRPVFRGGTHFVRVDAYPVQNGKIVEGLQPEDFEILEDGKPQTLRYFFRGDQKDAAPELHLGLLFDTSGSMTADIAAARTAAIKFLNSLPEAEDVTLTPSDPHGSWVMRLECNPNARGEL